MTISQVLAYATGKEVLLDKQALDLLKDRDDFQSVINELQRKQFFVASEKDVLAVLIEQNSKLPLVSASVKTNPDESQNDSHSKARFKILADLDVTGQSNSEGKVQDFLHMFQEKFLFLESLLRRRQGLDPKPINRFDRLPRNKEFHFISMVRDKIKTKNGHYMFTVEDMESQTKCICLKQDEKTFEIAKEVILDDVVAFKAVRGNGDLIIIKDIVWPEMPQRAVRLADRDAYAVVISDIHVGSKLFLEKEFSQFLSWLNGQEGSDEEKETLKKVYYLFVVGDNVDGIGVYPNQYDYLAIPDINKQYEKLDELLTQVPENIEIFLIPGQHDAVRRGEPQPSIPKTFFPKMALQKNFHLMGNPSWLEIENGIKVLMYHGASMHDAYSVIDRLDHTKPHLAIMEMLKRRDLMAGYGVRNPYVPEKKHFLLVREEPDIYLGGDMHHTGYGQYRGCLVVNGSCFQSQTDFEVSVGNVPTPGIVPLIRLSDGQVIEKKFGSAQNP